MLRPFLLGALILLLFLSSEGIARQEAKWAIVAMVKRHDKKLERRNNLLAAALRPYVGTRNITVLMFSEKQFPSSALESWRSSFTGVGEVKFIDTAHLGFWDHDGGAMGSKRRIYGYEYMCKFFMFDLYEFLDGFDYYIRCDTDCYVQRLDHDLLSWAEEHRIGYSWGVRKLEPHRKTARTLPHWVAEYTRLHGIQASALMDLPLHTAFNFYNNWHMGAVSFFRSVPVRSFLQAVNASGGVRRYRWGDSTIQAYAVRLFMSPERLQETPALEYVHGSHRNRLVSTLHGGNKTNVPARLPPWNSPRPVLRL
jgi:hypothetical protein